MMQVSQSVSDWVVKHTGQKVVNTSSNNRGSKKCGSVTHSVQGDSPLLYAGGRTVVIPG